MTLPVKLPRLKNASTTKKTMISTLEKIVGQKDFKKDARGH